MLPFIFEWHWIPDRLVFMGLFYLALALLGVGLTIAFLKTLSDLKPGDSANH
ncbi:MAG: hypothetical protein SV487_03935 [Thermodesulfobacteriota bacterium]|nr:hypothetical protein [Thermodesulfobacteriota bacterium]